MQLTTFSLDQLCKISVIFHLILNRANVTRPTDSELKGKVPVYFDKC